MAFILESSYRCIFVNLFFHYVSPTLTSIPYLSFYLTHRNFQLSKLDFLLYLLCFYFPDGSGGKELAHQYRRLNRCGFNPWVRKIPWRRKWQPTLVFLPEKFHGQRSLVNYSPWGSQSWTRLSN